MLGASVHAEASLTHAAGAAALLVGHPILEQLHQLMLCGHEEQGYLKSLLAPCLAEEHS